MEFAQVEALYNSTFERASAIAAKAMHEPMVMSWLVEEGLIPACMDIRLLSEAEDAEALLDKIKAESLPHELHIHIFEEANILHIRMFGFDFEYEAHCTMEQKLPNRRRIERAPLLPMMMRQYTFNALHR
jgi:hypothetical protein